MPPLSLEKQLAEEALNQERAKTALINAETTELHRDREASRSQSKEWGKLVRDGVMVFLTLGAIGGAIFGAGWGISWLAESDPFEPCIEIYKEDHHDLVPGNNWDPSLECDHPDHIITREEEVTKWGADGEEPEGVRRVKLTCQCPMPRAKHKANPAPKDKPEPKKAQ